MCCLLFDKKRERQRQKEREYSLLFSINAMSASDVVRKENNKGFGEVLFRFRFWVPESLGKKGKIKESERKRRRAKK